MVGDRGGDTGGQRASWRGIGRERSRLLQRTRGWLTLALVLTLLATLAPPLPLHAQNRPEGPGRQPPPQVPSGASVLPLDQRTGSVHVMIELEDEPAVVVGARAAAAPGQVSVSSVRSQTARINGAQQTVLRSLQSSRVNARVLYRVQKSYNGIAAIVDAADVPRVRTLNGVRGVRLLPLLERQNSASVPLINAPAVWTGLTLAGQSIKVGIIDSGIDYLHANFGGNGSYGGNDVTQTGDTPGFFPDGPAVVGGFDFAGDAYNADSSNPAHTVPQPDPDPMDCASTQGGGHGSHVAGTAAGRGVNSDGTPYAGPYNSSIPFTSFRIGPGVAPQASLYALKVFGCTGSTVLATQAIEWALDPNGDGDFADHLDVVNLSLGANFTTPEDAQEAASNNASLAGMIVVGSAGNAGDTTGIAGGVGGAPRSISVAASNDSTAILDGFNVTAPPGIAGIYAGDASSNFNWAALGSPISGTLAYPPGNHTGCATFGGADAAAIDGKIALLDWTPDDDTPSPCASGPRVSNAAAAGALGVVFVYNLPLLDITIGGAASIPAVITTSTTGTTLKANLAAPVGITFDKTLLETLPVVNASEIDRIGTFTSRGPKTRTGALKPDLAAPGVSIFSTESGTGSGGASFNGTSMAAPHVAGLMALLRQQHPTWTVEELKALAMNTANHDVFEGPNQTGLKFAPARTGAGRIDADLATTSTSIAYETDAPGTVSVSFGAVESLGSTSLTRTVQVANKGPSADNYTIGYTAITEVPGATIVLPDGPELNISAGGTTTFRVQLNLDAASMKHPRDPTMDEEQADNPRYYLAELSGLVVVTPSTGPPLRVPLHAAVRPASDMHAAQSTLVATSPTQSFTLGLTGQGVNTGSNFPNDVQSLVSAFELHAVSPAMPGDASPEAKAGDLRFVGASSDGRVVPSPADAWLYFGVATEQNWLLPASEVTFFVYLDVNRDGTDDFLLYNTRLLENDEPTDVVVTALQNLSTSAVTVQAFINGLSPNITSAVFDNNVLVLPVPVSSLGLTIGNPRFNYRVESFYRGVVQDATTTVTYDWLNPGIDIFTTPGQSGFFFDLPATTVPITYNQANVQQNGALGLVLFHHFNRDGQRVDVVTIGQTQTIVFAGTTPTTKILGDPPFVVTATASSGLPVVLTSQTPTICTVNPSNNLVTLLAVGTCTLRATQAGNATFLPASADRSIDVVSGPVAPCVPRPSVGVVPQRTGPDTIQVTVTAGSGLIQTLRFGTDTRPLANGTVTIDMPGGTQQITTGATLTMPPNTTSKTFTATRGPNPSAAMTVPMVVTDGCGAWETFVGLGTGS